MKCCGGIASIFPFPTISSAPTGHCQHLAIRNLLAPILERKANWLNSTGELDSFLHFHNGPIMTLDAFYTNPWINFENMTHFLLQMPHPRKLPESWIRKFIIIDTPPSKIKPGSMWCLAGHKPGHLVVLECNLSHTPQSMWSANWQIVGSRRPCKYG